MRRVFYLIPAVLLTASFVVAARSVPSFAVAPGSNGAIAFESDRDGDLEIFTIRSDGTGLLQLTHNTVADRNPAWSPDGTTLVFVRDACNGTCRNLWQIGADGTGELQLTNEVGIADADPTWSPDGTTIAFAHPTNDGTGQFFKQIWTIPAAGGSMTKLTSSAYANWSPDWSPDGSKIVFYSTRVDPGTLYSMNADGTAQAKVTFTGASTPPAYLLGGPSWSPDGTTFAFHGANSATLEVPRLVLANVDGTDTRTLWDPTGEVYPPSWAPDGQKLVVTVNSGSGSVTNMQLYVVDASDGSAYVLASSSFTEQNPSWQPTAAGVSATPSPSPSASPSPSPSASPSPSPSASPSPSPSASPSPSPSASPSPSPSASPSPSPSASPSPSPSASPSPSPSASPSPSPTSSPPPLPPPDGVHVEVTDNLFTPASAAIPLGGTIVFDHLGPSHHTATDGTGMLLYDSGSVDESSPPTWYTFEASGRYPFICVFHPEMSGRAYVPIEAGPATGPAGKIRKVTYATAIALDGFAYDVQIRRPGKHWTSWRKGTPWPSASFLADAGKGTYRFRARLREVGQAASGWSRPAVVQVG